jgi:hypothetical protein
MRGTYNTLSLGEALQKIKILKVKDDILNTLKSNWDLAINYEDLSPYRYNSKTGLLTVKSSVPVLYIQHFCEPIMIKCNSFLGHEVIKMVKIIKA